MKRDCTGRIVSRNNKTRASYRKRYRALRLMAEREERAGGDIDDVVGWFCSQNHRWKEESVRHYRAAIAQELEDTVMRSDWRNQLERRLSAGPTPLIDGPKRTSAKKRKSLELNELATLDAYLKASKRKDDWLINCFLAFGVALFLRPMEYLQTRVEGSVLIVQNAKASNGRANGEQRKRDIADMGPQAIAVLQLFLRRLRKAATEAGGWDSLHGRLASRLARVCKAVGVDRVSLYTMRHVGMATAKTWLEPHEVAAAAGHGSVHTATSHYAKRRTGWQGFRLAGKPLPESIAKVRGTVRYFQPARPRQDCRAIP